MRIGLVSQWYDPEGGAAATPGVQARALRDLGHEVHVLTGFPNYPTGRLHEGYRLAPYRRESLRGIDVHRSPLFPSHDGRAPLRAANYLSLAAGATAVGLSRFPRVDAVLVHATPMTMAIPAVALRALRRTPFVLHVQDLWPDSVTSSELAAGMGGRLERVLHAYCDATYRRAAHIAVTSPGMADRIAARGVPRGKLSFVPNWADEASFRPVPRDAALAAGLGLRRPFTVMYAGNLGSFQDLDTLVDAATRLQGREQIGFALVGGGVAEARLRRLVAARRLDNVTFVPNQPFERMSAVLALGDLQVVSLQDLPLFRHTIPSKLQAAMAAGRPVVGALTGDAARLVTDAGAGRVVAPGDAGALAQAVGALADLPGGELSAMGDAGRHHYLREFSEAVNARRLGDLLQRVSTPGGGR